MALDRRTFVRSAGGLAAASALAGCLGGDEPTTTLWHGLGSEATTTLDGQLSTFAGETGQQVEAQQFEELRQQLETTVPLGDGPDLFGWAHDWTGNFEERSFLYDASEALSIDVEAAFVEPAADAAQYGENTYGLPYAAETVALLYNEDMVDRPPATVDELTEAMDRHHDPDGQYGLAAPVDPYTMSAWLHAGEGFYYDDERDAVGVAEEATVEALAFYRDTLWPYQPDSTDYQGQVEPFRDGNAAFLIDGPWALDLESADIDEDSVGVAPLPSASIGTPSPYVGVQLWYFSTALEAEAEDGLIEDYVPFVGGGDGRPRAVDNAVAFAEWYTTAPEVARTNADEHLFVPVLESVADEYDDGRIGAFVASTRDGTAIPKAPEMRAVWEPLAGAIAAVLSDDADPDTAMSDAETTILDAIEGDGE